MGCKERLETYLRDSDVPFETHRHPEAFTAQEVAASEHVPGKLLAKVIAIWADEELALAVLPAPYELDLDKAPRAVGSSSVRLAAEDEFSPRFPDCEKGAMPPFGNLYDVPVYADRSFSEPEEFVFQAGTHSDTIHMQYGDFLRLVEPKVVDLRRETNAS